MSGQHAISPNSNPTPYKLEEQVGYLLRLVGQRHTGIFQNMAPLGLTPTQFSAFVRLAELGQCSQNELGRRTAMDVATIKGVIDRLRAKGLVEVNPDPKDKRRALLSIPADKQSLAAELHRAGHQITKATLDPLSPPEQENLLQLLKKMAGGV